MHLVGLYTHCNMMHGTYNVKLINTQRHISRPESSTKGGLNTKTEGRTAEDLGPERRGTVTKDTQSHHTRTEYSSVLLT